MSANQKCCCNNSRMPASQKFRYNNSSMPASQKCRHNTTAVLLFSCVMHVLWLSCFRVLWSPEGKGLTSWLLFVMFMVILLLSNLVSWNRCGIWCIDSWSLLSFLFCIRMSANQKFSSTTACRKIRHFITTTADCFCCNELSGFRALWYKLICISSW